MCYRPLHITNRSRSFDPASSAFDMYVPCGKCVDCQDSNNADWFVRSFFEWKFTEKNGGSSYFYTLTFAPEHLPFYKTCNVFRPRCIQLFIKRLRERLSRLFGHDYKVNYLVVSEYGDERGRSHHHVELFFNHKLASHQVYYLVLKCWQYGFVQPGSVERGRIVNFKGIRYVAKYISKTDRWTEVFLPKLTRLLVLRYYRLAIWLLKRYAPEYVKMLMLLRKYKSVRAWFSEFNNVNFDFDKWLQNDYVSRLMFQYQQHVTYDMIYIFLSLCLKFQRVKRSYAPFHTQSQKFGYSLVSDFSSCIDWNNELVRFRTSDKEVKEFHLPRVYQRMLWYDRISNKTDGKRTSFVMNDAGVQHKIQLTIAKSKSAEQDILDTLKEINTTKYDLFSEYKKVGSLINDRREFELFTQNLYFNPHQLYVYRECFRGRVALVDFDPVAIDEDTWPSIVTQCYEMCSDINVDMAFADPRFSYYCTENLYNYKPYFLMYEEICKIVDIYVSKKREEAARLRVEQRREERDIKRHMRGFSLLYH